MTARALPSSDDWPVEQRLRTPQRDTPERTAFDGWLLAERKVLADMPTAGPRQLVSQHAGAGEVATP
jgi:hypothetical protein